MRLLVSILLVVAAAGTFASAASAQMFSYSEGAGRAVRSVTVGLQTVDFQYAGSEQPAESFTFRSPAYAITLTQPNLLVSIAFADQAAEPTEDLRHLKLLDANLFFWGSFLSFDGSDHAVYVPLLAHTGYRRVDEQRGGAPAIDAFSINTLGLGTGLAYRGRWSQAMQVSARATPVVGLSLRNFEGSVGSTRLFDADVQVHFGGVFGRFGLSAGYNFRVQNWNVDASDLFTDLTDELFDYRNRQHLVRVGLNW